MDKWIEGNTPKENGWYWVTAKNGCGKGTPFYVVLSPLKFENGNWIIGTGGHFYAGNVVAYSPINMPEVYQKFGDPGKYYIRVIQENNRVSIYSKGLHSVGVSTIGYDTPQKAYTALKRLKVIDLEETLGESENYTYEVINGEGNIVER